MHEGPFLIPDIDRDQANVLFKRVKPLVRREGQLWRIRRPDLFLDAFPWAPRVTRMVPEDQLEVRGETQTLHKYGFYGFFKPSVAEVLAQIPKELEEQKLLFEVVGPNTFSDLTAERKALNAGFHVATTTFYRVRA